MTSSPDPKRGFSVVEVVVALIVLTVGVLGLAATTVYVVQQTTLAEVATERAAAVQTVVEQLRARPYAALADSSGTYGPYDVKWTVTPGARSKLVTIVSVGPGLQSGDGQGMPSLQGAVADTFSYRILRP